MAASVWLKSDWCTTLVARVADCYFAQGLPWLIPFMPREASQSLIHSPTRDAGQELIIAKPAKWWMGVPAVYTDGSKRDVSLSFARTWTWTMALERQHGVLGPASSQRTILQAE